jgi:hypothetical protein
MMVPEPALVTLADSVNVKLSLVDADHVTPVAVPLLVSGVGVVARVASDVDTALLNTAVNNIGPAETGSDWPAAWLIVTVHDAGL